VHLIFNLSPTAAKELSSELVDINISSPGGRPVLSINGVEVMGNENLFQGDLLCDVRGERVKAEDIVKKEEPKDEQIEDSRRLEIKEEDVENYSATSGNSDVDEDKSDTGGDGKSCQLVLPITN
jgi:hypothetical protein